MIASFNKCSRNLVQNKCTLGSIEMVIPSCNTTDKDSTVVIKQLLTHPSNNWPHNGMENQNISVN